MTQERFAPEEVDSPWEIDYPCLFYSNLQVHRKRGRQNNSFFCPASFQSNKSKKNDVHFFQQLAFKKLSKFCQRLAFKNFPAI